MHCDDIHTLAHERIGGFDLLGTVNPAEVEDDVRFDVRVYRLCPQCKRIDVGYGETDWEGRDIPNLVCLSHLARSDTH